MDALYCRHDFETYQEASRLVIDTMPGMLSRFDRVVVIRTLLKQDMVPARFQNSLLKDTYQNHARGWALFKDCLIGHPRIEFHETEGFELEDFFSRDNHWTPEGNEKFARLVLQLLK